MSQLFHDMIDEGATAIEGFRFAFEEEFDRLHNEEDDLNKFETEHKGDGILSVQQMQDVVSNWQDRNNQNQLHKEAEALQKWEDDFGVKAEDSDSENDIVYTDEEIQDFGKPMDLDKRRIQFIFSHYWLKICLKKTYIAYVFF